MNQKIEITKKVLELQGITPDEERVKKTIPTWWFSTRSKENGGLRLTEQGFDCLQKAGIKSHKIRFEKPITVTNQVLIWIDQLINCPFYITSKEIYVFSDKVAVQLVLFSGNIERYVRAKANKLSD